MPRNPWDGIIEIRESTRRKFAAVHVRLDEHAERIESVSGLCDEVSELRRKLDLLERDVSEHRRWHCPDCAGIHRAASRAFERVAEAEGHPPVRLQFTAQPDNFPPDGDTFPLSRADAEMLLAHFAGRVPAQVSPLFRSLRRFVVRS